MPGAQRTHALLDPAQRPAARIQRRDLILFVVCRGTRTIEYAIARRLQQDELMMLTEFGQAFDGTLLAIEH